MSTDELLQQISTNLKQAASIIDAFRAADNATKEKSKVDFIRSITRGETTSDFSTRTNNGGCKHAWERQADQLLFNLNQACGCYDNTEENATPLAVTLFRVGELIKNHVEATMAKTLAMAGGDKDLQRFVEVTESEGEPFDAEEGAAIREILKNSFQVVEPDEWKFGGFTWTSTTEEDTVGSCDWPQTTKKVSVTFAEDELCENDDDDEEEQSENQNTSNSWKTEGKFPRRAARRDDDDDDDGDDEDSSKSSFVVEDVVVYERMKMGQHTPCKIFWNDKLLKKLAATIKKNTGQKQVTSKALAKVAVTFFMGDDDYGMFFGDFWDSYPQEYSD